LRELKLRFTLKQRLGLVYTKEYVVHEEYVESVEQKNALGGKEQLGVMPKIAVMSDEAVIDSPPMVVYKAILNEYAGVTHWWMPYWESKLRGDMPMDREGAIFDITNHNQRGITSKYSFKITKIVEAKSIEMECFSGDFVGTGEWTFEPTDGKTRVQFRGSSRPKRLLFVLLSPFVDIGKAHSDMMQKGFKALNSYLSKK
jgi:hypothetical protein